MRNIRIEEVMNGWKVSVPSSNSSVASILYGTVTYTVEEYVFNDWSEMMEFIEDYFADEEE